MSSNPGVAASGRPASPDLSGLSFRMAESGGDVEQMLRCRWHGYRKYGYIKPESLWDEYDERALHLVCVENSSGDVLGTLRILSRTEGPVEAEDFVEIDGLAEELLVAELSRFCVPVHRRALEIKLGLWKCAWLGALKSHHGLFLIWVRPSAAPMYAALGFEEIESRLSFDHPLLGNKRHVVMTLNIVEASSLYEKTRHPLHEFFCVTTHPSIIVP